eukprot:1741933-Amphidinium_carterae.1
MAFAQVQLPTLLRERCRPVAMITPDAFAIAEVVLSFLDRQARWLSAESFTTLDTCIAPKLLLHTNLEISTLLK